MPFIRPPCTGSPERRADAQPQQTPSTRNILRPKHTHTHSHSVWSQHSGQPSAIYTPYYDRNVHIGFISVNCGDNALMLTLCLFFLIQYFNYQSAAMARVPSALPARPLNCRPWDWPSAGHTSPVLTISSCNLHTI